MMNDKVPRLRRRFAPAFIALGIAAVACSGQHVDPPPEPSPSWTTPEPLLRRMTDWEYRQSASDVALVALPEEAVVRDKPIDGFSNAANGMYTSAKHIEDYFLASQSLARETGVAALVPTDPACDTAACLEAFVEQAGAHLFGRDVEPFERDGFTTLMHDVIALGFSPDEASHYVLEAMFQSPSFLYRIDELDQRVSGRRMARKLSFFIRGAAPDEALLELGSAGYLDNAESLHAVVDDLLAEPRGRRAMHRLVGDWLRLAWVPPMVILERDQIDRADSAVESATWLIDRHLDMNAPIIDLFSSNDVWVDGFVAPYYGLADPVEQKERPEEIASFTPTIVNTADDDKHAGLLTHPAFIAAMSDETGTSIVHRGVFFLSALACASPLAPPQDLDVASFTNHLGPDATERDYADDRADTPGCNACHASFDPLAFAFEPFSAAGYFQETNATGKPLRTDGVYNLDGNTIVFDNPADWAEALTLSPTVQRCVTRKMVAFAIGRRPTDSEGELVDQLHDDAWAAGGGYAAIVHAIVDSPLFRGL